MRFGMGLRDAQANQIETVIGTQPKLQLRTGAPPTNISDANAGTEIAEITLPTDWLSAASGNGQVAKSGTWQVNAAANGLVAHYRIYNNAESVPHIDGLVSMPWAGGVAVQVGQQMHSGGNVYRCDTAGTTHASTPPSGTGADITNGTAQFDYVGPVDMTVDNVDVAVGQTITVNSFSITIPE
jgi:hypothetical protein